MKLRTFQIADARGRLVAFTRPTQVQAIAAQMAYDARGAARSPLLLSWNATPVAEADEARAARDGPAQAMAATSDANAKAKNAKAIEMTAVRRELVGLIAQRIDPNRSVLEHLYDSDATRRMVHRRLVVERSTVTRERQHVAPLVKAYVRRQH